MRSKFFERFESAVFRTTGAVFGEQLPATWVPADGSATFEGIVFFNDPTDKETLDKTEFVATDAYMEYLRPAFDGLKLSVDRAIAEEVTVGGTVYYVRGVMRLHDGNTFRAYLEEKNGDYGQDND